MNCLVMCGSVSGFEKLIDINRINVLLVIDDSHYLCTYILLLLYGTHSVH